MSQKISLLHRSTIQVDEITHAMICFTGGEGQGALSTPVPSSKCPSGCSTHFCLPSSDSHFY